MGETADGVLPLSLIVLARNEEAAIGRCLDSVPFAAEKIVVDSGSTDGTAAAAAAHGATVIDREWLGFGPMRQRAEEDAAHEWILMLDADEWMSDELQRQCRDELPGLLERADAVQLSRRTRYCGRTMNHYRPFARDHIWRCYRKGRAAWTSDQVHERLQPAPGCRTHRLTAPLIHMTATPASPIIRRRPAATSTCGPGRRSSGGGGRGCWGRSCRCPRTWSATSCSAAACSTAGRASSRPGSPSTAR